MVQSMMRLPLLIFVIKITHRIRFEPFIHSQVSETIQKHKELRGTAQ